MVPQDIFESKFDLDFDLPVVFIDTHFNRSNAEEQAAVDTESSKLLPTRTHLASLEAPIANNAFVTHTAMRAKAREHPWLDRFLFNWTGE